MSQSEHSAGFGVRMVEPVRNAWRSFETRHRTLAEFIMFFVICNTVTVLQLSLIHI